MIDNLFAVIINMLKNTEFLENMIKIGLKLNRMFVTLNSLASRLAFQLIPQSPRDQDEIGVTEKKTKRPSTQHD